MWFLTRNSAYDILTTPLRQGFQSHLPLYFKYGLLLCKIRFLCRCEYKANLDSPGWGKCVHFYTFAAFALTYCIYHTQVLTIPCGLVANHNLVLKVILGFFELNLAKRLAFIGDANCKKNWYAWAIPATTVYDLFLQCRICVGPAGIVT